MVYMKRRGPDGEPVKCSVEDCIRIVHSRGLCSTHYQRKSENMDAPVKKRAPNGSVKRRDYSGYGPCAREDCESPAIARGLCQKHYSAWHRLYVVPSDRTCERPGCEKLAAPSMSVCKNHYRQAWRYGLSVDRFLALWDNPVCSNSYCDSTDRLTIDHDHSCCLDEGAMCGTCVRGLLCHKCNVALGMIGDDPDKLRGLIEHLSARVA